jgi:hypothetical protein
MWKQYPTIVQINTAKRIFRGSSERLNYLIITSREATPLKWSLIHFRDGGYIRERLFLF